MEEQEDPQQDPRHLEEEVDDEADAAFAHEGYTPLLSTAAVFSLGPNSSESEDDDSEHKREDNVPTTLLADQALQALEADYQSVLRHQEPETQRERHENTTSNEQDQRDNQIIAAAFDRIAQKAGREDQDEALEWDESFEWKDPPTENSSQVALKASADTSKIQQVVQGISEKKDSKFNTKFQEWQDRQKFSYKNHAIIPAAPLKSFSVSSAKAKKASAHLTRSATVAEGLVKCAPHITWETKDSTTLRLHVVGVDAVECQSADTIRWHFCPLVRWLDYALYSKGISLSLPASIRHVELHLIGRDLRIVEQISSPMSLLPEKVHSLASATAICANGVYDEWLINQQVEAPHLMISFHAGLWGYAEWATTLQALIDQQTFTFPIIVTSYSLAEAQDDEQVLQDLTGDAISCLWSPCANPYASRTPRTSVGLNSKGTAHYRENAAWQGWLLGG